MDQLREALGLPRGVDASSPHPDTAVRIQEQVTRSSNISVSHVLDSVLKITEFSSECVFERIKQVFKYFPHIKDSYIKSIGKINVEIVDDLKKIHLADVGIKLSLKPDAQAQAELEQNIQASLAAGKITLDDAQEASDYGKTSMKLAKQLLRVRRLKKEKDEIANRHAEIEKNGEQQVNLAKQQAAAKEEQLQMTLTIDQSRIQSEAEGKIAIEREKDRLLKERLDIEYGYKIQLAQIEKSGVSEETKFKEQEKRLRQDKNNTDNSRITEQRLNNSPSQDFSQA